MKVTIPSNLLIWIYHLHSLVVSISTASNLHLQPEDKNIYIKNRLDKICNVHEKKTRINVKHEVVSVFTFNSSLLMEDTSGGVGDKFKCHLELYLPSSSYGFSVFIEEMSLSGSIVSECKQDYVQFGRDILFVTTHLSPRYCGDVELPVPRSKNGVMSFDFPFTPLARRIYNEEEDKEMDIWINIDTTNTNTDSDRIPKTLTLVVTPFKKSCATRDSLYQQCRFSTKCVRRELFCDGRINCAWPYVEPADEVHCLENLAPEDESYLMTDLLVIFLVLSLLAAMIAILVVAVNKYGGKVAKSDTAGSGNNSDTDISPDLFCQQQLLEDHHFTPSCPPAPPPPYTPVDSLSPHHHHQHPPPHPPPSYSLLMPTRST